MANERTVIELVIEGAQRSVVQIQSVARAQTDLVVVQESLGVRQRKVYNDIARAADEAAKAQEEAAKRAEKAAERSAKAASAATTRQRDPSGRFISREADQQQRIRQEIAALQSSRPTPEMVRSQVDAASFTAARNALIAQREAAAQAAAQAQTLQGRLQALGQSAQQLASNLLGLNRSTSQAAQGVQHQGQAAQQQAQALRALATQAQHAAAAQDVTTKAGSRLTAQMLQVANAANRQANALAGVTNASSRAGSSGLSYLSVLSAIHAASFLSTNQTFSMVGSFLTLGLAFNKVGLAASGVGIALGGLLAIFGVVSAAIQTIQQATIQGALALAGFAGAATAASIAAGAAGIKMAADVETQLAGVRAFGGATTEQLKLVADQADELGARFGVATADVVQAASLFARAGGTVKEAIAGATEAIIRLQVASQGELSAAQAAIALSSALKQFNLTGADSIRVADNITAAVQASALSFTGFQQAFVQAAPGAAALGISIEDLSTAIALIGDRLVKGTLTGTAFKQAILDIINPTAAAKKIFQDYDVSLKDTNNNMLPLIDIIENLHRAFGAMVDAEGNVIRQQDAATLAAIGGARAFLALNIITAQGAKGFQEYRDKLAQVSTAGVVDVLLLPLNKQLERVPILAQQAGAAFGGPLLQPARAAVVTIIGLLEQIKPAAELVGQAIRTILVGQGFEALQKAIENLVGNNALSSFLIELINTMRNVKDVIETQIVPAVLNFGRTLATTFSELSNKGTVGNTFEAINVGIRNVGVAAAVTIDKVAQLTREFILGIGVGGELRQRLLSIAQTVATNLVASFQLAVVVMGAAVAVMPLLAQAALAVSKFIISLANVVQFLRLAWSRNIDSMLNTIDVLASVSDAYRGSFGAITTLKDRIEERNKEGEKLRNSIILETQALNGMASGAEDALEGLLALAAGQHTLVKATEAQVAAQAVLRKSLSDIVAELITAEVPLDQQEFLTQDQLNEFTERAGAMREAARQQVGGIVTVFDDAQGSLGSILDNITADIERRTREIAADRPGGQPAPLPGTSKEELDKARARIDEAGRDISRRLANLTQDSAKRVVDLIARSMERLDDIKQQAIERIEEIREATEERIGEARRSTKERREDRDEIDAERQKQEDLFTEFQRGLDRQAVADQRNLDDRQRARQLDSEDASRSIEQDFQDFETIEQRKLAVVQRAFEMVQQARATAFDRAQQLEATAFQRSQQAAAEARQFSLSLAEAKTPEERTQLTKQRSRQIQDTKFQQGQEEALAKFRLKQEEAKLKEQRSIETEAIGFRQGLEERFLSFKRQQEAALLKIKRAADVKELQLRRDDEDGMLKLRLKTEDIVQARRKEDALALQAFQQSIEDKRIAEEEQRTRDKALKDIQKEVDRANRAQQEEQDKLFLNLIEQTTDVQRQVRNIIDALLDLQDAVPPELLGHFLATLGQARVQAEGVEAALGQVQRDAKLNFAQQRAADAAEIAEAQQRAIAGLATPALSSSGVPSLSRVPGQVLSLQTLQVAQVVLPARFTQDVAAAVQLGIQQAVERGLIPSEINIDLVPVTDRLDRIQRGIG